MSEIQSAGWQSADAEHGRRLVDDIYAMSDGQRRSLLIFLSGWLGFDEWDKAVAGFGTMPTGLTAPEDAR